MIGKAILLSGELLISGLARVQDKFPGANLAALRRELLGDERGAVHPLYTSGVSRYAKLFGKTPMELALRHTLVSFHLPFLPTEVQNVALHRTLHGGCVPHAIGVCASGLLRPKLFVCAKCVCEDESAHGIPTFRTAHAAAPDPVCSKHGCMLVQTSASSIASRGPTQWLSPRTASWNPPDHDRPEAAAVALAETANWLVEFNETFPGVDVVQSSILTRLHDLGWINQFGRIRCGDLIAEVRRRYSERFLLYFGSELNPDRRDNWLLRLLRPRAYCEHPARYLFLIQFLGLSIREVLTQHKRSRPPPDVHVQRYWGNPSVEDRQSKKREWLRTLERHGSEGGLRERFDALYSWLWRYERTWLLEHRPHGRVKDRLKHKNWAKIDSVLKRKVSVAARRLRKAARRVSRCRLAYELGHSGWLIRPNPNLPNTERALSRVEESAEDAAVRRIRELEERGPTFKGSAPWRLRTAAGVSVSLAARPRVSSILNQICGAQHR